jgi:DNA-binding response OmpR family regulator
VLLDVNMPPPNGLAVCRELRTRSRLPIMMLTVRDQEDDLVAAFDAGADDYVRKPFSPRILLARIHALTRRADPLSSECIEVGPLCLDFKQQALIDSSGAVLTLTRLELKVIQLLMAASGRTVSTERLTLHVWGRNSIRERRMLKQLVYRLRQKLDSHWSTELAVQSAPGPGYKLFMG